jgi:hypothetical protein
MVFFAPKQNRERFDVCVVALRGVELKQRCHDDFHLSFEGSVETSILAIINLLAFLKDMLSPPSTRCKHFTLGVGGRACVFLDLVCINSQHTMKTFLDDASTEECFVENSILCGISLGPALLSGNTPEKGD